MFEEKNNKTQLDYSSWVELCKNSFDHNIAQYKNVIGDKILAPVIKSNAYGHGISEIAQFCEQNKNVGWLCVATLSEALALRSLGIKKSILVLSYMGKNVDRAAIENISLTAYNFEAIKNLNTLGKNLGKTFKIHIKIDTGLSRLGVQVHKALDLIKMVKDFSRIEIQGIWTHFAESQSEDRTFTNKQIATFEHLIKAIMQVGVNIPFVHMSNSSGMITVNSKYDNFARMGIGVYGYWGSEYIKKVALEKYPRFILKPVLTWKTKISDIKRIPAETFVGYSRMYITKRPSKIGILPIGYFDGLDIRLSNKGYVLIKNQCASIIGRVCMNVIIVDITNLKDVKCGDEVILIGNAPKINAFEIGEMAGMNPREVTTKIHPDIPRVVI
jgi:alanine racemase